MKRLIVIQFILFFLWSWVFGQEYSSDFKRSDLSLENKTYPGYETQFDFSAEDVRFGFWKYSRSFGIPRNMRGHYEIIIPASGESNTELKLFSKTTGDEESARFQLAINTTGISESQQKNYLNQASELIRDFKLSFYRDYFQGEIDQRTKRYNRLGKRYKRLVKKDGSRPQKSKTLDKMLILEEEIRELRLNVLDLRKH